MQINSRSITESIFKIDSAIKNVSIDNSHHFNKDPIQSMHHSSQLDTYNHLRGLKVKHPRNKYTKKKFTTQVENHDLPNEEQNIVKKFRQKMILKSKTITNKKLLVSLLESKEPVPSLVESKISSMAINNIKKNLEKKKNNPQNQVRLPEIKKVCPYSKKKRSDLCISQLIGQVTFYPKKQL